MWLSPSLGSSSIRHVRSLQAEAEEFAVSGTVSSGSRLLLAAGSSQGGAQPKAAVRDDAGALWIAKFPVTPSPVDQSRWEQG